MFIFLNKKKEDKNENISVNYIFLVINQIPPHIRPHNHCHKVVVQYQ